jgi:hypothetical protein
MKYTDQEWFRDMYSDFKSECKKELKITEQEMNEFLHWATDDDIHPMKGLVSNITQSPKQTFNDWKTLSNFVRRK